MAMIRLPSGMNILRPIRKNNPFGFLLERRKNMLKTNQDRLVMQSVLGEIQHPTV